MTKATTNSERLCGFTWQLPRHWASCKTMDSSKKLTCVFCGQLTYQFCELCQKPMHKSNGQLCDGTSCFFLWHDTGCFGLVCADCKDFKNKKQKDWTHPNFCEIAMNEWEMKRLSDQVNNNKNNAASVPTVATATAAVAVTVATAATATATAAAANKKDDDDDDIYKVDDVDNVDEFLADLNRRRGII